MPDDTSVLTRASRAPDRVVAYGAHDDQVADVRFGGEGAHHRPLVLIVHGGFWRPAYDRAHTGPMAEAIADAGWTVASLEYRRIPGKPDETLHDVSEGLAKVPARIAGHDGRVILIGHSAGGHLVLWLAACRATSLLVGTIALAPAADLQLAHDLNLGDGAALAFLGVEPAARTDADPKRLPSPAGRVTIVHGDADDIVPISVARSYLEAHASVTLLPLGAAGHFALIDPLSASWPAVLGELRRLSST